MKTIIQKNMNYAYEQTFEHHQYCTSRISKHADKPKRVCSPVTGFLTVLCSLETLPSVI